MPTLQYVILLILRNTSASPMITDTVISNNNIKLGYFGWYL